MLIINGIITSGAIQIVLYTRTISRQCRTFVQRVQRNLYWKLKFIKQNNGTNSIICEVEKGRWKLLKILLKELLVCSILP
jgi:hypothetical protein